MSDKEDLIYDLLKQDRTEASDFRREVRDSHKDTREKLTELSSDTSDRLTKIEATNTQQNTQLSEHMRRTDILEDLHRDNQGRIETLEEPAKIRKSLRERLIMAGKVAGALMAITAAAAYFLGIFK